MGAASIISKISITKFCFVEQTNVIKGSKNIGHVYSKSIISIPNLIYKSNAHTTETKPTAVI